MPEWADLNLLERLPNRLRKSPYTVGVSEPMTEVAMGYWQATLNVADQFFVPTATWGLTEWERLVGITPAAGQSLADRRREVIAKLCSTGTTNAEMIRALADRYGVRIIGSELVGLTPAKALLDCAEYYLKMENFDCHKQVMEYHLVGME